MSKSSDEKKRKEALQKIEELKTQAMELIKKAEVIADEANVTFNFDVSYGMGGTYFPKKKEEVKPVKASEDEDDEDYDNSDEEWDESGWVSSSSMC